MGCWLLRGRGRHHGMEEPLHHARDFAGVDRGQPSKKDTLREGRGPRCHLSVPLPVQRGDRHPLTWRDHEIHF